MLANPMRYIPYSSVGFLGAGAFLGYKGIREDRKRLALSGAALCAIASVISRYETASLTGCDRICKSNMAIDVGGGRVLFFRKNACEIRLTGLPDLTDAHLAQLAKFRYLKKLTLEDCPLITGEGLTKLTQCKCLHFLHIKKCPITLGDVPEGLVKHLIDNQRPANWKPGMAFRFQAINIEA